MLSVKVVSDPSPLKALCVKFDPETSNFLNPSYNYTTLTLHNDV